MKLKNTDSLEVVLASAVATSQCPLTAGYSDVASDASTCAPNSTDGQTNGTTAVTWVAAPGAGNVREISDLSFFNADTANVTATVRINNGTTTRVRRKFTLAPGESFAYESGSGFGVFAADGSLKSASTAVLSVQQVGSAATVTPVSTNDFIDITAQAAGLTLANPSGTPSNGWGFGFRIKDDGTSRAITWGSMYRGIGGALPTATTAGKRMIFGAIYNATDGKVDVILPVALEV